MTAVVCPTGHKHADVSTCYIQHRCRCLPCKAAHAGREMRRKKLKAYGRWNPGLVDAGPVRDHLAYLAANGYGYKRVAALADVSVTGVRSLLYGRQDPGPRYGEIPKRCAAGKAAAILAVRPDYDTLADGARISARGTIRRLQALVAVGWSQSKLGDRLGVSAVNMSAVMRREQVTARFHRQVAALYDELWDQQPAHEAHHDLQAFNRARNHAVKHGWAPPLAWDDIDQDPAASTVDATDDVDELAIDLVLEGHDLDLTRLERQAVVRRLTGHGHSAATIAARLGITTRTVTRDRNDTVDEEEAS